MDNIKEINNLINSFIEYRNVLMPLQETLHSVSTSFVSMKTDIESLQNNFDVDTKKMLENMYSSISEQMKKSEGLYQGVQKFIDNANQYTKSIESISRKINEVEEKLTTIKNIESQYEKQIRILDELVETKKINYEESSFYYSCSCFKSCSDCR